MASTGNIKKDKILVIEGHKEFGQQIAKHLAADGFESIFIEKGADAMKLIYDQLPRLIIFNIDITDIDSYDILEKKNSEPLLKKIPVILISTQGIPINMSKIPQGSVADIVLLYKEDPAEVVNKVKKCLGIDTDNKKSVSDARSTNKSLPIVLWIEDDNLINSILGKKLTSSGFKLLSAKNGEDALKFLKSNTPDVIVTDLILPSMSGFELLQKIDMEPTWKKIPVMVLSNLDSETDREKAKMLGARKFFVKASISLDQVPKEIVNLIEGK